MVSINIIYSLGEKMIDYRIKLLLTVAEEKNFTKAAEVLCLTQPAVSHHIKELENELNTQIFIRKKGEIIPTPTGEIIINYARRIQSMYDKMREEIVDIDRKINLRIGITHTAESNKTITVIGSFLNTHKSISMTMFSESIANLYQKVENYELDFAVVDQKQTSKLNYLLLDTDSLVCVVNPNSPLVQKKEITLEELKKENLILRLPSSSTRILFNSTLNSINESIHNFNVILELDNIATIKELVRKSIGVSILAKSTCMNEVRKNKLAILPIANLNMQRSIYFIYNDNFNHLNLLHELKSSYARMDVETV